MHRRAHHLDRAAEIALQPAQVCGARIGLVERLEVDHLLICLCRFGDASLFQQHITEEAEVEDELPGAHQTTGKRLCLAESMQLMQHVTA